MRRAYIYIIVLMMVACGCVRRIYVPRVSTRTIVDTVVANVADSAVVRALFECDSSGRVLMNRLEEVKSRYGEQQILFEKGRLEVETKWKTKIVEREVVIRDTVSVVEVRRDEVEKPFIPKVFWVSFFVAVAGVVLVLVKISRFVAKFF